MSDFKPAKKRIDVSVGESVRIVRELQDMSQNNLADASGIPQSTISAIENDRINLGVERAKTLARVLETTAQFIQLIDLCNNRVQLNICTKHI